MYLDEIHQASDWSRHLKVLYDSYPKATFWASGSNSLLMISGISDLSRRFVGILMPLLSFREYLVLRGHLDYGIHDVVAEDGTWVEQILADINVLGLFEDYLHHGFRPFFAEGIESYQTRLL